MKVFSEKVFSQITKPLSKEYRQTTAWLSASFGRNLMYYKGIIRHPEEFRDWAAKSTADRVLRDFKELFKHDKYAAKMLYETYRYDLWEMVRKTLNEEPSKYFEFYYRNEEA